VYIFPGEFILGGLAFGPSDEIAALGKYVPSPADRFVVKEGR
jgi:hypothetical protein